MPVNGAERRIREAVLTWQGVQALPHRFGGEEFRVGKREIGHVHGDYLVDVPFPTKVRDELVAAGLAEPHHILPRSGWISFYLRGEQDVQAAIGLLRRSYEIAMRQKQEKPGVV